jgi:hypothetical protein
MCYFLRVTLQRRNLVKNVLINSINTYRTWHYATSRKVAGSDPNEVIGFFN